MASSSASGSRLGKILHGNGGTVTLSATTLAALLGGGYVGASQLEAMRAEISGLTDRMGAVESAVSSGGVERRERVDALGERLQVIDAKLLTLEAKIDATTEAAVELRVLVEHSRKRRR